MRHICIVLFFSSFILTCRAQSQEKNYSTLIVNFARTIQWPAYSSKNSFIIGVMDYGPLEDELRSMASTAKVSGRSIEVMKIISLTEVHQCQIVFLPAFKGKILSQLLKEIKDRPTLVITNKMDSAKKGSGINFLLVNGKLQYEINSKSIEARGLKVPASIKSLGIEVAGGG
jgi:hypothetical protein